RGVIFVGAISMRRDDTLVSAQRQKVAYSLVWFVFHQTVLSLRPRSGYGRAYRGVGRNGKLSWVIRPA
ncbi:MAG: hypothetical protein ACT6R2_18250, partial [Blastomonas fulva]|uniref:hypothetical protein n=1 Tax=Blastomonas fulva TaxID=1550728 RepID=UPI004033825C